MLLVMLSLLASQYFLDKVDLQVIAGLEPISILSWFVSTIAGGGSSLLLMPIIGLFLGAAAIAPVTTTGAILGNADRAFAYRKHINWGVILWEVPGAIFGSLMGAFILTKVRVEWIGVFVGIFLIVSALNYLLKEFRPKETEAKGFHVRAWYFLPGGFVYSLLSGILGSMGPLLAPFYIGFGLQKEELLATQATARVVVHIVKIFSYAIFGILLTQHLIYGLFIGLAAIPGNWLGHLVLQRISENRFRQLVMIFVMFSGLLMLWQEWSFLF
ncbi:sulfite exporter TauE/SafE family protein [Oscillatoria salina]|uniref:sulfite exporter TauE/SafE family protein n=1 Tax=Oscillatoria salina TaxID=331517 RepID=UPI001CCDC19C|nr:sulfite exporter TauE/SafE family protein [Oscillatoria salina]